MFKRLGGANGLKVVQMVKKWCRCDLVKMHDFNYYCSCITHIYV